MSKKSQNKKETVETKVTTITKDYSKELSALPTTSAKIRYLNSQNVSTGEIAKILKIRYQWVRNVLITPVSKPKA